MDYRYLGNSGLKISEITYGNWLTHGSQVEEDAATACVRRALDEGIEALRPLGRLDDVTEERGDHLSLDVSTVSIGAQRRAAGAAVPEPGRVLEATA